MADRRPLIINTSAQQIQEFTDSDALVLSGQSLKFLSPLIEKVNNDGTSLSADEYTHNMINDGNVLYLPNAPTANFKLNLTGSTSPGVTLNTMMDNNTTLSFSMFINGTTFFFMTDFTIDGGSNLMSSIYWQGGADPTTRPGAANSFDNYAFTIIKTGSATFKVFGALASHAQ